MDARVVVTGANGFVGRTVVRQLLASGADVVATDLQPAPAVAEVATGSLRYVTGDLTDARFVDGLVELCGQACAVVHLAALLPRVSNATEGSVVVRANVLSTLLACEAAQRMHAHLVFSSSALVYGDRAIAFQEGMERCPGDYYGLSKSLCEQIVEHGVSTGQTRATVLRFGVLYGPGQGGSMFVPSIVRSLVAREVFEMTAGEQTRDFVYVDDVAELVARCALRPRPGTYNIGTGIGISMKEVAELTAQILDAASCLRVGALPYRPRESWHYCLNSTKARCELGWDPRTPLRDGLRRTIEHYRTTVVPGGARA